MGKKILFKTVDSTNNYLKRNHTLHDDRTVVIAENQTAGRGRFEREFVSKSGGLYLSVLLKNFSTDLLTISAGISVADVLRNLGADPKIKWVNDVFCGGKKVCGILAESVLGCAIVGIGVNIKHNESFPDTASSLDRLGIDITAQKLADLILETFFYYIDNYNPKQIIARYRLYTAFMIGKHITYNHGAGIVECVTDNGNLSVIDSGGNRVILNSGEISVNLESFL